MIGPDGTDADPALIAPGRPVVTHGGLRSALDTLRPALSDLPAGARLATLMPDRAETLILIAAAVGMVSTMPLSPDLTDDELRDRLADAGATALAAPDNDARARRLATELGIGFVAVGMQDDPASLALDIGDPGPEGLHPAGLVLLTSGTTGTPKRVPLSPEALSHSARTIAATLQLGPQDRALHMLPMSHVGAIVDLFLAPLSVGGAVILAHPMAVDRVLSAAERHGATWLQGVPTMWHALLSSGEAEAMARVGAGLRFLRSVSSDLAPEIEARLSAAFGGCPVIQMYGLTETAGQVASNPLDAPRPGSVGRPDGADVAILDRAGNPVAPGETGEIVLRGPGVTAGYEGTARHDQFVGDWMRTGDLGRFDAEGFLHLSGRLKEQINRGGEKISPAEIERALLALPGVAEAVAYARPHPTLGEVPAAAVTLAGDGPPPDFDAGLAALAPFKRPRTVRVLESFPRLASGKIDRRAVAASDADDGRVPREVARSPVGQAIAEVWSEALHSDPPHPDADFFDAGGDSLSAAGFVTGLEARLGVSVPADLLYRAPTPEALEAALADLAPAATHPDLPPRLYRALKAGTAGLPGRRAGPTSLISGFGGAATGTPLFWCGARSQARFADVFAADRPLYLMRNLARIRQKSPANEALVARAYAREIGALYPEGPIQIGGFCQGARMAHRVLAELQAAGREITLFIGVDWIPPVPLPCPAVFLWSTTSGFSAAARFPTPEAGLPVLAPAGGAGHRLPVTHADILTPPTLEAIHPVLAPYLDGTGPDPAPGAGPAGLATGLPGDDGWRPRARITMRLTERPRAGRTVRVAGRVTNAGPDGWPAAAPGGLRLAARMLNLDGHLRDACAGHWDWPEPLAPAESAAFEMAVRIPSKPQPYLLELSLIRDGLWWARDIGLRSRRRLIWPRRA